MITIMFETVIGLLFLFAGGELLVRGAVALAHRLRIQPALIGLTVVAWGTSLPEMFASLEAALTGSPGIAIGNVIGSNIANILLVGGLTAVVATVTFERGLLKWDGLAVAAASLLYVAFATTTGQIAPWMAGPFLAGLIGYTVFSYWRERQGRKTAELHAREAEEFDTHWPLWANLLAVAGGLLGVIFGAQFLVTGAVGIAQSLGIPETMIGLTLVAVGTSLPELATSLVAARRGHGDVAMANILGSNFFNLLGILGIVGLVAPIPIGPEIIRFDNWVLLATTLLFVLLMFQGRRLARSLGGLFLIAYALYIGSLAAGL